MGLITCAICYGGEDGGVLVDETGLSEGGLRLTKNVADFQNFDGFEPADYVAPDTALDNYPIAPDK